MVQRKFVIDKNKEESAEIERTGIANITSDRLFDLAKKILCVYIGPKMRYDRGTTIKFSIIGNICGCPQIFPIT